MITYYFSARCQLDDILVIFNNATGKSKESINTLIIVMKQYIYSSKCLNEDLSFLSFMGKLSMWYQIDKLIASENDTQKKCEKKWKSLF